MGGKRAEVHVGSIRLKNPVLGASGTFGYGLEYLPFIPLEKVGGFVVKTLTRFPKTGNPPPRIVETPSGLLNSIGLENMGLSLFKEEILPRISKLNTVVVLSIGGEKEEDLFHLASETEGLDGIRAVELNISCPNLDEGGISFGRKPSKVCRIVKEVRNRTSLPLWVKLTPEAENLEEAARAAEEGGADALTVANTFPAMAVDWRRRTSRLGKLQGGLSGPAIKPLALRMVWQTSSAVQIPVIGAGGIGSAEDVLEFIVAGAKAVQVGTLNFQDPSLTIKIVQDLENILKAEGIRRISSLSGTLAF